MKNKKGKMDLGIKNCKNCGNEYHENDNYNWSCKTHHYPTYSGEEEIWWCCGKRGKDVPGCKVGKHISKEDEDDEDDQKNKNKSNYKMMKCYCCKEMGHLLHECPRDPNIKTRGDPLEDNKRIQRLKDFRKLFTETMVTTTHFLKNCIKVPKLYLKSDKDPDGVSL